MLDDRLGAAEQGNAEETEFIIGNRNKYIIIGILNEYGEEILDYEVAETGQKYIVFAGYNNYETAARQLSDIEDTENDEYEFERSCCSNIFIYSKDDDED